MWIKVKTDIVNLDPIKGIILGETKITFIGGNCGFEYTDKKYFPKGNLTTEEFNNLKTAIMDYFTGKIPENIRCIFVTSEEE